VGIGGARSHDLIQAGTAQAVTASGQARFQAWIEMLPQPARQIPVVVHPGDSVSVSITQQGTDDWLIVFKNNTTGQNFQQTQHYASSRSSADWVVEAPSSDRGLLPLDNFGAVVFTEGSTVRNGKTETIAQSGAEPIILINSRGQAMAVPSQLSDDGVRFGVERTGAPPTDVAPRGRRGG
jgi:hypothetical protein